MTELDEARATLALTEAALKNAQEQRDACAVEALEQRQRAEKAKAALDMLNDAYLEAGASTEGAAAFQALKIAWLAKPPDWMVARELAADSEGYSRGSRESHRAQASAVIYGLGGGDVDGAPATHINYLQLVRRIGEEHAAFGDELNNANVDLYDLHEALEASRAHVAMLREALVTVLPDCETSDWRERAEAALAATADSTAWLAERDARARARDSIKKAVGT